jgi:hypothetical protein
VALVIAAGASIPVAVSESLNSDAAIVGQYIQGTVPSPVQIDRKIAVPAGTKVVLQVKGLDQAGRIMGAAKIDLALVEMTIQGKKYTVISSETAVSGPSKIASTVKKGGIFSAIGTGVGCGIGHVTGRGSAGCAAGTASGRSAGAGVSPEDKTKPALLKAGSVLSFKLDQPLSVVGRDHNGF